MKITPLRLAILPVALLLASMGWRQVKLADELRGLRARAEAVPRLRPANAQPAVSGVSDPAVPLAEAAVAVEPVATTAKERIAELEEVLRGQETHIARLRERLSQWEERSRLELQPQIVEFEGFINYGSPIEAASLGILPNSTTNLLRSSVITPRNLHGDQLNWVLTK
jgi:hypothetical protein